MHPARAWRWKADDCISAIAVRDRFPHSSLIVGKIGTPQQPAIVSHPLLGSPRKWSAIKPIDPLLCNAPVTGGQIRLFQEIPFTERRTIRAEKYATRTFELLQFFGRRG